METPNDPSFRFRDDVAVHAEVSKGHRGALAAARRREVLQGRNQGRRHQRIGRTLVEALRSDPSVRDAGLYGFAVNLRARYPSLSDIPGDAPADDVPFVPDVWAFRDTPGFALPVVEVYEIEDACRLTEERFETIEEFAFWLDCLSVEMRLFRVGVDGQPHHDPFEHAGIALDACDREEPDAPGILVRVARRELERRERL